VDDADKSQDIDALFQRAALERRRPTLPAIGRCYFCEEPIQAGNFCDIDCSRAWDRLEMARSGNRP
jgi:hypothetical protein